MAIRNYVGARYVPKFADPVEWQANTSYEAMVIVTYNNASYTSKVPVSPTVGNPAENSNYWALTGNYNAQVEEYRQETEEIKTKVNNILPSVYPVGSIYISTASTSPASIFGGTWEQIKDKFLLAAGDNYTAGSVGGEARHTLTIDEMPAHKHTLLKGEGHSEEQSTPGMVQAKPDHDFAYADTKNDSKYYWTSNTLNTGGGNVSHNNMPPYLTVYAWKRIA